MNYEPLKEHNFSFSISRFEEFQLSVKSLDWDIKNKTLDFYVRLFEDQPILSLIMNNLALPQVSYFNGKLEILTSKGKIQKTIIFDGLDITKHSIKFDYQGQGSGLLEATIQMTYKTSTEV